MESQVEAVKPTTAKTSSAPERGSYGSRQESGLSIDSFLTSVKTVAKLQKRAGLITIIVLVAIIWGLMVCFIISYAVSRTTGNNNENQTQNSSLACLQMGCNTSDIYGTSSGSDGKYSTGNSNDNITENITCSDNFYLDEETSQCKPECGEWGLYSARAEAAVSALTVVSIAIGTIGGVVVLVVSCINHKEAFTFPSALVRYQTASFMVLSILVLIGRTNPRKLFCNSKNLAANFEDPTTFCSLIGFAFSYCYWQVSWFWLIHISVMFWGIRYPFHAHKFESTSKMKYLHITTVLLAFIVPWIPVGTIFITGGYTFVRYPPLFCSSRSEGAFFFLHLPLGLLVPIGSTLLTNVLWTICKRRKMAAYTSNDQQRTVEVKIIIVVCYFLVIGICTFASYTVRLWQNIGMQEFTTYFNCEGDGGESECDRSVIDSTIPAQVLLDISQITIGLFPAVNLVYAINIRKIKDKWNKCRSQQTAQIDMTKKTEL